MQAKVLTELNVALELVLLSRNKLHEIDADITFTDNLWYYFSRIHKELDDHKQILSEIQLDKPND
jgi:hypothetical protein